MQQNSFTTLFLRLLRFLPSQGRRSATFWADENWAEPKDVRSTLRHRAEAILNPLGRSLDFSGKLPGETFVSYHFDWSGRSRAEAKSQICSKTFFFFFFCKMVHSPLQRLPIEILLRGIKPFVFFGIRLLVNSHIRTMRSSETPKLCNSGKKTTPMLLG